MKKYAKNFLANALRSASVGRDDTPFLILMDKELSYGAFFENAEKLAQVPIWAFHGTADAVVPEQASLKMIKAIRRAGGRPAYTSLEGVGHGSWHFAYGPHGAMEWMFAQQNPTPPDFGSLIEDEVISP